MSTRRQVKEQRRQERAEREQRIAEAPDGAALIETLNATYIRYLEDAVRLYAPEGTLDTIQRLMLGLEWEDV